MILNFSLIILIFSKELIIGNIVRTKKVSMHPFGQSLRVSTQLGIAKTKMKMKTE